MKITKDTTLGELIEIQRMCLRIRDKGPLSKAMPCDGCEHFEIVTGFKHGYAVKLRCECTINEIAPFDWDLPLLSCEVQQ